MEMLAVVLLPVRDDRFGFAELVEHHDQFAALDLLDLAGEQLTDPATELVANLGALTLADALDDPLLRGLDGSASKLREVDRDLHRVADLKLGVLVAGLFDGHFAARILDLLDYSLEHPDVDRAAVVIDRDFRLYVRTVLLGQRGLDPVFEQPVQLATSKLLRVR